jgi:TolB-like protein/DNA-binding winged helix-turn-helix (wHTH) protein/Flp pilus assembly protein TadD
MEVSQLSAKLSHLAGMVPRMAATHQVPERVSFGEFQLNLRTREIQTNGRRFDLQEQPFMVLSILLEHSGDLVTREDLIKRLWPSDTFVDFEHSLNKAVKRLREALNDSAEQPRFIETLPRRGYRFIGTVTPLREESAVPVVTAGSPSPVVVPGPRTSRWPRAALAAGSVALLAAAMGVWWIRGNPSRVLGRSSAEPAIRSLAVLPLENLSGDPAQDYFADGMTDALITDLGQIGALRVISRTSIMQYKGARKLLPEIARELNIDAVVEGTVVHSRDRVRITAQLIEAHADKHLWAQSYEGELRDVLGLQNQVARAIADQIRVKLTPQQKATLETAAVVNPKAHELYLEGHYFSEKDADDGSQKAIVLFQQAIAQQPDHALAYVGLANAYIRLGHTLALPPEKAFLAAKAAALKALEINDNLGEAHTALGQTKFLHDWDFIGAEKEFQRAVALNPSSARAQNAYASFLNAMGRPDEAVSQMRMALQVDPVSLWAIDSLSAQLYWARRYGEAVELARKSVEMDPNRVGGHFWLGLALEQKHDFPESIARLKRAVELSHDKWGMAFVAHARALSGDKAGARKILEDLEQRSNREYVSPWWMAMVYPDLGDKQKAFFWLEKAYRGREHDLVFSQVWPMFDSLRSDPRYKDLIRRVGLPQADTGRQ